jgi:glucosyl-3-phosphoglycerate synthase
VHRYDYRDFDTDDLTARKAAGEHAVSLCIPARNEAATIGAIVEQVHDHPLVDEVLVVDDHSRDGTADAAASAGARVVHAAEVLAEHGAGPGKGQALWKATAVATGDLLAFCDGDVRDFSPHYVVGLLGPLLTAPGVCFVKAFYERPGDGHPRGGGRVTELVARPMLHLLFPHLAGTVQPLAGEFAGRRSLLERLPFVEGYGVDIGLLIDAAGALGVDGLAQVDLGRRVHRNRPLADLGPMAAIVLMTALQRAGIDEVPADMVLDQPDRRPVPVRYAERPPLVTVPGYVAARDR